MHGSSASSCENEYYKQAMLTVSQLLKFNTFIRKRKDSSSSHHSTQRERPLPVYIGLMIHNKTPDLALAHLNIVCHNFQYQWEIL